MLSTYYEPASQPHSVTIRVKGMKKSEQSGKTDSFISRISPFLLKNTLKNYIHIVKLSFNLKIFCQKEKDKNV